MNNNYELFPIVLCLLLYYVCLSGLSNNIQGTCIATTFEIQGPIVHYVYQVKQTNIHNEHYEWCGTNNWKKLQCIEYWKNIYSVGNTWECYWDPHDLDQVYPGNFRKKEEDIGMFFYVLGWIFGCIYIFTNIDVFSELFFQNLLPLADRRLPGQ